MITVKLDLFTDTKPKKESERYTDNELYADFLHSPWLYYKKVTGLAPMDEADFLESAFKCRVLLGRDRYEQTFFGNMLPNQTDLIENMASGIAMNDAAIDVILYGMGNPFSQTNRKGVHCVANADWLHPTEGATYIITCDDIRNAAEEITKRMIPAKAGFFRNISFDSCGVMLDVWVIAVEKKEPYTCGIWKLSDTLLCSESKLVDDTLAKVYDNFDSGFWGTMYDHVRVFGV